jgi:phage portal protein BeeE
VLSTDLVLDKEQVQSLRDRWNEQAKGLRAGGTPILTAGLKVQPWAVSAKDSAIAEVMKFSDEHIALAYRIPLQILGIGTSGSGAYSTEVLMQHWIASGLGFALNHVEEAFGQLFGLRGQPDEYVEFDTAVLLRSAQKERLEALARGVQGGIYSPNEARALEGLPEVKFGGEPRVQQQVVPLSAAANIQPTPSQGGAGPLSPKPPPAPTSEAPPSAESVTPAKPGEEDVKRHLRAIYRAADRRRRSAA